MKPATIHGYADQLSVAPGETIEFKVSAEQEGSFRADVVRLVHGDTNPAGPGFKEEVVETAASGDYPARHQPTNAGSCVVVDDPGGTLALRGPFALSAYVFPTLPGKPRQCILGRYAADTGTGYALLVDEGHLTLLVGDGERTARVAVEQPLVPWTWYSVEASYDPAAGRATVAQRPVRNAVNSMHSPMLDLGDAREARGEAPFPPGDARAPFVIAGMARDPGEAPWITGHFNGKIDSPSVRSLAPDEVVGRWDFSAQIGPRGVPSDGVTGTHRGRCVNQPARGMTGWNWDASEECYRHAPELYGAIHFHDDDLDDCRWDTDVSLAVPDGFRSGVYALRVTIGDAEDHVPFFVLPPRGRATAKILLLIPTASYLAYANDHIAQDVPVAQSILGHTSVLAEQDFWLYDHLEFGLSTYDAHLDGSGVCFSSARRPIVNMRPKFRHATGSVWQFPADLHLVDWLEHEGYEYDVATDLELHEEGVELLRRYRVVMTGSHPEYYSERMLDAWEEYLGGGGRGMYLGSNGFYWITEWHPEKPWLIEIRKCESGSRAWQAKPGEHYLATTGKRSGLWRNRARPPQKLFATGFTSEGFDFAVGYVQLPDARDERAAWILEGIGPDEVIGDFGLAGGGAAGYEIDRYDLALGTPPQTLVLATALDFSANYPHVVEEIFFNYPGLDGTNDFQIRADLTYFTTPGGGAVFSTSSISWCGSLSHDGYDNNCSRLMHNVLRRFAADEPVPPL